MNQNDSFDSQELGREYMYDRWSVPPSRLRLAGLAKGYPDHLPSSSTSTSKAQTILLPDTDRILSMRSLAWLLLDSV